jgi:hypothetical protein
MDSNTGKHNYSAIMDTEVSLNSNQSSPRDRVELPETEEERPVTVVIEVVVTRAYYILWYGRLLRFATNASWVVNWSLLIFKAVAFYMSLSKAVAAALADSVVDLLSQFVLSLSER